MLFYLVLRTSNIIISALKENDNFDSYNFLMGDNSVDMRTPVLDNGEPNSTMANQIVYSLKKQLKENVFAHRLCHHNAKLHGIRYYIVLIYFGALRSLSTANAISERPGILI